MQAPRGVTVRLEDIIGSAQFIMLEVSGVSFVAYITRTAGSPTRGVGPAKEVCSPRARKVAAVEGTS